MDTHEIDEELNLPAARELLGAPLLRLAYDGPDGFPRVLPIGFLWTRGRIVVCTATTSPKVRALSERPRVAMTIDAGKTPADAVSLQIRGTATLETVDGVPAEYLAASAKVMPSGELHAFETAVRALYERMVRITIEPTWAKLFDFGAGRVPGFLRKLAAGTV